MSTQNGVMAADPKFERGDCSKYQPPTIQEMAPPVSCQCYLHPGDGAPVGCVVAHVHMTSGALETLLLDRTHLYGDIIDCKIHIFVTLVFRRNQRGPIGLVHICTVACSSGLMI